MKNAVTVGTRLMQTPPLPRVYCAGPLFNRAEQGEMAEIARTLEGAGFRAFLPQRDGVVFTEVQDALLRSGYDASEATRMAQLAIFWLGVFEVVQGCQGLVANLNGRVPDEGAVAEAAIAWSAGKKIVLYKSDNRSLLQGCDNPLVAGLGQFVAVSTIPEVAYAFSQLFRRRAQPRATPLPAAVKKAVESGRRLSVCLSQAKSPAGVAAAVIAATRSTGVRPTR